MGKWQIRVVMFAVMGLMIPSLSFAQKVLKEDGARPEVREGHKLDLFYKVSNVYLLGATTFDMSSTVHLMDHPTIATRADGSLLADYHGVETGWAGCFGQKNAGAVVLANVGLNIGVSLLSRKLYRMGGRWRILAIGLNVLKGTSNLMGGIHNTNFNANQYVSNATGYHGTVIWSH